jgi:Ca2+-binding EF-hand superfamily protein
MFRKQAYTVEEAFSLLDHQQQGYLSNLIEIDQFLRSNGKVMTKDELVRLFRVLSFDKGDQVSY